MSSLNYGAHLDFSDFEEGLVYDELTDRLLVQWWAKALYAAVKRRTDPSRFVWFYVSRNPVTQVVYLDVDHAVVSGAGIRRGQSFEYPMLQLMLEVSDPTFINGRAKRLIDDLFGVKGNA